jgi:hypothetical protein
MLQEGEKNILCSKWLKGKYSDRIVVSKYFE